MNGNAALSTHGHKLFRPAYGSKLFHPERGERKLARGERFLRTLETAPQQQPALEGRKDWSILSEQVRLPLPGRVVQGRLCSRGSQKALTPG